MADVTKRMNYFDRQFLRAADFQDEQAYNFDRRHRHNRLLHAPGIAEGLQVSGNINDDFVTVSAGTAYDALGQEIVLARSEQVNISRITGEASTAHITIAYREQASDPSTDPGVTGISTRISEQPALLASATPPGDPNLTLPLANVAVANGKVTAVPDNTVRNQAGAVLGQDLTVHSVTLRNDEVVPSAWPKLICSAATTASLQNAGLTSGEIGIGTTGPTEKLHVESGNIFVNGERNGVIVDAAGQKRVGLMKYVDREAMLIGSSQLLSPIRLGRWEGGTITTPGQIHEDLIINSQGNVGIGTANPDTHLTVQGSTGGTFLNVKDTSTTTGGPFEVLLGVDSSGGIVSTMTSHDLQLRSGGNHMHVVIKNSGKVGIGTNAPLAALQVNFDNNPIAISNAAFLIENSNGSQSMQYFSFQGVQKASIRADSNGNLVLNAGSGEIFWDTDFGGPPTFNPAGGTLDVVGLVHASSFPTSSDERFKMNVTPLTDALEKIDSIQGVAFDWNELYESLGRSTGRREIGVIAQEVEKVFPELVSTWHEEGYRAVDYGRLTAVLVEAIKELKAKNESLERRIEALENTLGAAGKDHARSEP
jgi:hypothetical protein